MTCVKCGSEKVVAFDSPEGVTVEFCRGCGSLWFEKGELAFYVETEQDVPQLNESMKQATETEYLCMQCPSTKLLKIPYLPSENLMIDICPKCHGVFLDKKEIVQIEELVRKNKLTKIGKILSDLKAKGFVVLQTKKVNHQK